MKLKGCGNHGCRISPPKGQGTNSICRCFRDAADHIEQQDITPANTKEIEVILQEAIKYWRSQ